MYIVRIKIGYQDYEFRYGEDEWTEANYIINSLVRHASKEDMTVEVTWEPVHE